MKNYSKQREAILEVLRCTDTHPTANWIYEKVRETLPNISLGTVYRNLAQLSQSGEILSLHVADGFEHFDFVTAPHAHLHCKKCGAIIDAKLDIEPLSKLSNDLGFTPQNTIYVVYGICKNCKQ
jgi:Fe2+ or Zn2+ uptake regulation protein